MSYTPGGIDLLVAACDRADTRRRRDALLDARAAHHGNEKDLSKMLRGLERLIDQ